MKKAYITLLLSLSAIITTAQINVPAYVPTGALMGWWPFTGNAYDSSGHGNNGVVIGSTLTTDRFGHANSAYNFDGISNYISIPANLSLALTKSVTIAAWVHTSVYNPSAGQAQIFWRGDLTSAHDPYMLYLNTDEVLFRRDIDPGTVTNEIGFPTSIINVSEWHHVAGTYNIVSGVMKVYYDGNLQDTANLPGTISYALPTYWNEIGAVDSGTWQFFTGDIDDVGAWDRDLAPCEINKLYLSIPSFIVKQPKNDTIPSGGTATYTINDTGTVTGGVTYQWQENSGTGFVNLSNTTPYSGVFTKTLVISPVSLADSGNLYRCVRSTDNSNCVDTSDAGILVLGSGNPDTGTITGVQMLNGGMDIKLVPNPNNGEFTINGICRTSGNTEISLGITNMLGQTVYSNKIIAKNGKINEHFYLKNILANGVYLLRLHSETTNKVLEVVITQ